jgi:sigma-B regulation protein RsbU (phosphoserine phosphatase)
MSTPSPTLQARAAALLSAETVEALLAGLGALLAKAQAVPAILHLVDGRERVLYHAASFGCPAGGPDLPLPSGDLPPGRHLLCCGDLAVGVLTVAPGSDPGIKALCDVLGPALVARHRLEESARDQMEQADQLAGVTAAAELLRHLQLDTLLVKVLETALGAVRAQVGALVVAEGSTLRTRVTLGLRDEHVEALRLKDGRRVQDAVLADGAVRCVPAERIAEELDLRALNAHLSGLLALPLITGDRRHGVVLLANPERGFGPAEQRVAQAVCGMAAIAFDNALLVQSTVDRERMRKELDLARGVQMGMYPKGGLAAGKVLVAGAARPCDETGGDYYTYVERGGRILAAIGDVSGHGLGAALYTTTAHAILHQQLRAKAAPDAAFATLNVSLAESHSGRFMTAAMVDLDAATGRFSYASAGHNPLLWISGGQPRWLESTGMPLGIMGDSTFDLAPEQQLAEGDALVLYTDGITEATNAGDELYGEARLAEVAIAALGAGSDAAGVVAAIQAGLAEFAGKVPFADDVTVVVLRYG